MIATFIGLTVSAIAFFICKNKFEKAIIISWNIIYTFLLLNCLSNNSLVLFYYITLIISAILSIVYFQSSKRYRSVIVIYIILILSIIRTLFQYPYYYEFLIFQIIITTPLIIYLITRSIKEKNYFTLFLITLYFLNEFIEKNGLIC